MVRSSFCRLEEEFKNAVNKFEENQVDCIVTWHAAYSPSLESIQVLANTPLPIVVLDTTETYDFQPLSRFRRNQLLPWYSRSHGYVQYADALS